MFSRSFVHDGLAICWLLAKRNGRRSQKGYEATESHLLPDMVSRNTQLRSTAFRMEFLGYSIAVIEPFVLLASYFTCHRFWISLWDSIPQFTFRKIPLTGPEIHTVILRTEYYLIHQSSNAVIYLRQSRHCFAHIEDPLKGQLLAMHWWVVRSPPLDLPQRSEIPEPWVKAACII